MAADRTSRRAPRRRWGALAAVGLALCALAGIWEANRSSSRRPGPRAGLTATALPGRRVGVIPARQTLRLALTLTRRHEATLEGLIAAGRTVSGARFAQAFLPSQAAVRAGMRQLARAGLRASWTPGSEVIRATGAASSAERVLGVEIDRYRRPDATTFYAARARPRLSGALRGVVAEVGGLSDAAHVAKLAAPANDPAPGCDAGAGGYTPKQILSAYNFGPLLGSGITGASQTVVFIEEDTFRARDLQCFASRYGESAPQVSLAAQKWGAPDQTPASGQAASESDLDLEIAHAIAPRARLVVFYTDGTIDDVAAAAGAAASAYPHAILSVSLGGCEVESLDGSGNPMPGADEGAWHSALERLAATGGTAVISSGDSGAFECGNRFRERSTGDQVPVVSAPASDPYATAVGGTTLLLDARNGYAGEGTWGSPFEATGSGGGVSALWGIPSWQAGPGVRNGYSDGHRQVPDVAALGDPSTGWDIFQAGSWGIVAGTSAAAPLWAGLMALGDQALARQHLRAVGYANLPLYRIGAAPAHFPAPAFNDVTQGTNLYYRAGVGWDYGTGWGTPNAAGLVDDLIAYGRGRR